MIKLIDQMSVQPIVFNKGFDVAVPAGRFDKLIARTKESIEILVSRIITTITPTFELSDKLDDDLVDFNCRLEEIRENLQEQKDEVVSSIKSFK